MPSKAIHGLVGGMAGTLAAGYAARNEDGVPALLELVGGLFGGVFGGAAPDSLEPADDPNHRGFWHSLSVGAVAGTGTYALARDSIPTLRDARARLRASSCELIGASQAEEGSRAFFLFLQGALLRLAAGFVTGATAGYTSHLALDAFTPKSLPLLTKGT